jgi:hypothetical protein
MATCTVIEYRALAKAGPTSTTLVGMEDPDGMVRHSQLGFNTVTPTFSQALTLPYVTIQSSVPFKIRFSGSDCVDPGTPDSTDHRYAANMSEPMMFPHRIGARFKIIEVS